jgi:hypothetical protein
VNIPTCHRKLDLAREIELVFSDHGNCEHAQSHAKRFAMLEVASTSCVGRVQRSVRRRKCGSNFSRSPRPANSQLSQHRIQISLESATNVCVTSGTIYWIDNVAIRYGLATPTAASLKRLVVIVQGPVLSV